MNNPSRILIVEDESIIAYGLAKSLLQMGFDVLGTVATGEEAITVAEQSKPDLVLMDVALKGKMDGIEAAQRITERVGSAIVYLTAHAERDLLERAKITGPYAYLVKPVPNRDLRLALEIAEYRIAMEKRLRDSEERFRLLLEDAPVNCLFTDAHGRLVAVNKACQDLLGYQAPEVLGRSLYGILAAGSRGRLRRYLQKCFSAGEAFRTHLEIIRSDGASIDVEFYAKPAVDEHRGCCGIRAVLHDVTEKRRGEKALKKSKAQFTAVFENSRELLLIIDRDNGTIVRANKALQRVLGHGVPEVTGKDFSFIWPGMAEGITRASVLAPGEEGAMWSAIPVICADGSKLTMDLRCTLIPWEYGSAVLASLRDVGQRVPAEEALAKTHERLENRIGERTAEPARAHNDLPVRIAEPSDGEEALRESEQRFRTIVDSATDCIFIKDTSRRYTLVNPALADLFGVPEDHLLSKTDEDLFGKEMASHLKDVDSRVLRGERVEEEHTRPIRGSPVTFLDTRFPMIHRNEIVGICGVSRILPTANTERRVSYSWSRNTDRRPCAPQWQRRGLRPRVRARY